MNRYGWMAGIALLSLACGSSRPGASEGPNKSARSLSALDTSAGGPSAFCHVTDGAFTACAEGGAEWSDVPFQFFPETQTYLYANQADLDPALNTPTSPVDTFMLMYDDCGRTTPLGPDEYFLVNFNTVEEDDAGVQRLEFYANHLFSDGTLIFIRDGKPQPADDGTLRATEVNGERGKVGFGPSPQCAFDHVVSEFEIKLSAAQPELNGGYSPDPAFWSSTPPCTVTLSGTPSGSTMNVGELASFATTVSGAPGPFTYAWTVDGDTPIKDYDESIGSAAFSTVPLAAGDFTKPALSFYWKQASAAPTTRTVKVSVKSGATVCGQAQATVTVQRTKQAEDVYTSNHVVDLGDGLGAKPRVLREHLAYHTNNADSDNLQGGRLYLDTHGELVARFDAWRAEFGYPALLTWSGTNPVPSDPDSLHSTAGVPRAVSTPLLAAFPPWFVKSPSVVSARPDSGLNCETKFELGSLPGNGGEKKLCDFPDTRDLLGCASEAYVSESSSVEKSFTGDIKSNATAPKDPLFWRLAKHFEVNVNAIRKLPPASGGCTPPTVEFQIPNQVFKFITALPSVSVRFSQAVTGVQARDLTVNGSAATAVTGSGKGPYVFTGFAQPAQGSVLIAVDSATAINVDGEVALPASWTQTRIDPVGDLDQDGVSNLQEATVTFTDPTLADTDGDGLPDGFELKHACLDPLSAETNPDPDNDGQTTLEEFQVGSDPCFRELVPGRNVIRVGFDANTLAPNDDGTTPAVPIGFSANFFGTSYASLFVNNNGNVTLDAAFPLFTPVNLSQPGRVILAPFLADVDTRNVGNPLAYGPGNVDGHAAFGVTWPGVGCFSENNVNVLNFFQLVLINRSDVTPGDFDIEFNYDAIRWESGQASGGNANCLGGTPPRVGFSNGTGKLGTFFELPGSGVPGALLDTNLTTGLIHNTLNAGKRGRYLFTVRAGKPNAKFDSDGDTVPDEVDNCPGTANVDQKDTNLNGIGDPCEAPEEIHDTAAFLQASLDTQTIVEVTPPLVSDEPPLVTKIERVVQFRVEQGLVDSPEQITQNLVQSAVTAGELPPEQASAVITQVIADVRCGNGILEPGEACDDGNSTNGDGCSAACTLENAAPVALCKSDHAHVDAACRASISIDNGSFDPDGNLVGCTQEPSGPYALGTTPVTLTCTDAAGLSSTCSGQVLAFDATPPSFSVAPKDIVTSDTNPFLGHVAATDACGSVQLVNNAPHAFPCGVTVVTWTATDGAGNRATARQNVRRLCPRR